MENIGQVLEDRVKVDLERHFDNRKGFYISVAGNVSFKDSNGIQREIDGLAVRHVDGGKRYIVVIECKLTCKNKRRKAIEQLMYARKHLRETYPGVRIFCLFAHSYNFRTQNYLIERVKNSKLNEIENQNFPGASLKN